jgi:hypothetical protein
MDEVENPYVKVLSRKSKAKLVIAFSSAAKKGRFDYYKLMSGIDASVILVNCPEESYYHFGIPSIGGVEEACQHIKGICDSILESDGEIITFGCSTGGYGALLFGSMLQADKILAFSPTCPEYTQRKVILGALEKHAEQYKQVKSAIFQSESKKFLIYGGVDAQDYASILEFDGVFNADITSVNGASHQIIEPLLHRYGLNDLLELSTVDFNKNGIDLRERNFVEYSTVAVNHRYKKSDATAHELISAARKHEGRIIKDDFYSVFYSVLLLEHYENYPLTKRLVLEALKLGRPVSLLSLDLLVKTLTQFDDEFIFSYCSYGIECANNKDLMSSEERSKMSLAIIRIVQSLGGQRAVDFFEVHKLENDVLINNLSGMAEGSGDVSTRLIFSKLEARKHVGAADILRDTAIAFEKAGDLLTAFTIMGKALEQRPHGPYIRKMLNKYRAALNDKKNRGSLS